MKRGIKYTEFSMIIDAKPPQFIGSQLRGALGYALKKVVCFNPTFDCNGCFGRDECQYFNFYENRNRYQKFRLDFELNRDFYEFSIFLFEDTLYALPDIVSSFIKIVRELGLGQDRVTFDNFDMFINGKKIANLAESRGDFIKEFEIDDFQEDVVLRFVTPLRIKKKNRFLRDDSLELNDLLISSYRRYLELKEEPRERVEFSGKITKKSLKFIELERYSNRQKSRMKLGGLIGEVEIRGLNQESYELLKIAELIGLGKQTTFGLGKVKLERIKRS
jgi:hypothetical protein